MRQVTVSGALALALAGRCHAFIGYGISMYNPVCAFACRSSIESAMLSCSDMDHTGGGMMDHHAGGATTAECRAGDTAFLTTLAFCIASNCADQRVDAWKLEKYWQEKTTGEKDVVPKWTYAQAAREVREPPTQELGEDNLLNFTALVPHDTWSSYVKTLEHFEYAENMHSLFG